MLITYNMVKSEKTQMNGLYRMVAEITPGRNIHLILRGSTCISRAATIAKTTVDMESSALDQTRETAMAMQINTAMGCRIDIGEK